MAPELIRARNKGNYEDVAPSCDVYSFGVVLVEMITRQRVFDDMPATTILYQVGNKEKVPNLPEAYKVDSLRPKWLPKQLVEVCEQCLSKNPTNRPAFSEITEKLKRL